MRERNSKRRRLDSDEGDHDKRDQAYFSSLRAHPLECASEIDPSYGRLPASLQRPGNDYVLTRGILLAQFASPTGKALADAVELISTPVGGTEGEEGVRLVDGVDLNCVSLARECSLCVTENSFECFDVSGMPATMGVCQW